MLYHAGVETMLTIVYSEIGKKVFKKTSTKSWFYYKWY